MEIRQVKYEELDDLFEEQNKAFNFNKGDEFVDILPKIYYKDNPNMVHFAAFDNGKIVSSIGLYRTDFMGEDIKLKAACVGAVSTLDEYRKLGLMSHIMNELLDFAKKDGYDFLYLGGDRIRYNHFGFENAVQILDVVMSKKVKNKYDLRGIEIKPLNEDDEENIKKCFDIYNKSTYRVERTLENFYKTLKSWKYSPYLTYKNDELIGYFCFLNNEIGEIKFVDDKYLYDVIASIYYLTDNFKIHLPMSYYDRMIDMAHYVNTIDYTMIKILNLKNVCKYLKVDKEIKEENELKLVRDLFGFRSSPCKAGISRPYPSQ